MRETPGLARRLAAGVNRGILASEAKNVRASGVVLGFGVLLGAAGVVWPVYGQDAAPHSMTLTLTEALNRIAADAAAHDDLKNVPPPRVDKLADSIRVTIVVGDPQCLPGEDRMLGADRFDGRRFRPTRSR